MPRSPAARRVVQATRAAGAAQQPPRGPAWAACAGGSRRGHGRGARTAHGTRHTSAAAPRPPPQAFLMWQLLQLEVEGPRSLARCQVQVQAYFDQLAAHGPAPLPPAADEPAVPTSLLSRPDMASSACSAPQQAAASTSLQAQPRGPDAAPVGPGQGGRSSTGPYADVVALARFYIKDVLCEGTGQCAQATAFLSSSTARKLLAVSAECGVHALQHGACSQASGAHRFACCSWLFQLRANQRRRHLRCAAPRSALTYRRCTWR